MNQQTIAKEAVLKGIGLHTGKEVTVTFRPGEIDKGIFFSRTDLEGKPTFKADPNSVVMTQRSTTIAKGEATITTIEHALAAVSGLQIDNIIIEVDGPEMPILDGSSKPFIMALKNAGVVEQNALKNFFELREPIIYRNEETGTELVAFPHDKFELNVMIDFNSQVIGKQYATLDDISDFEENISPSRTFVFLRELEQLLDAGLIKGGDLSNAIVVVDKVMDEEAKTALAKKLGKPNINVDSTGILNTTNLYFDNECSRHKLLDVVGDLALLNMPIKAKIIAKKPGHAANVELAKLFKEEAKKQKKLKGVPSYDPSKEPLYTLEDIKNTLPHRYPFLLVDKITELSKTHVVGVKNITFNEPYFQGHFPGNPVMPGVLQMEALAQTGGIFVLSQVEDPYNWDTYFLKMDKVKFKRKVVPGDTLMLKMELMSPIRRGLCHMWGSTYVGDELVSQGELYAQVVRSRND